MLLTIDIGNTNIKIGVYQGEQLVRHWRIATQRFRLADEYAVLVRGLMSLSQFRLEQITGCAISCVVPPLTSQFRELARTYLHVEPVFASLATANGIRFDVITGDGVYVGGAIAPGIGISAEALFSAAARLYQVELERPAQVIGKTTVQYMQSGLILGYTGLVEGLVRRMEEELGTACTVIATGGLADVIASETDAVDLVEPYLTLEGLRLIHALASPSGAQESR